MVVPLLKVREPYLLASFWVSVEEGVSVKIQGEVPFVVPRYLKHLYKGRFAEQNISMYIQRKSETLMDPKCCT